jgi:hypothetical protein
MDLERDQPRVLSPYAIAAIASSLVLLVSLALAIYFIELRGAGLRALMATGQAPEILVLFGIVGIVAIVGYLMVASAVRTSSPRTYRLLLRQALEDGLENAAIDDELDDVPELRELLGMAASERARAQDVTQQLNALRRDVSDLHLGMEQSTRQLEPLAENLTSDVAQQMARLWNGLLAQALQAATRTPSAAPIAPSAVAPPTFAAPEARPREERRKSAGMQVDPGATEWPSAPPNQWVSERPQDRREQPSAVETPSAGEPPTRESSERSVPLESELDRLWGIFAAKSRTAQSEPEASGSSGDAASIAPEGALYSEPVPEAPWGSVEDASEFAAPGGSADTWGVIEPHGPVAQWNPPPSPGPVQQDWMTAPEPPAPAAPAAPASGAGGRTARSGEAPLLPVDPDADQDFEKLRFPHFVGKPVGHIDGRVEVTYEADDENTSRLPDEALLFEAEEESGPESGPKLGRTGVDPIVDLRSLGAVEFDD